MYSGRAFPTAPPQAAAVMPSVGPNFLCFLFPAGGRHQKARVVFGPKAHPGALGWLPQRAVPPGLPLICMQWALPDRLSDRRARERGLPQAPLGY